MKRNVELEAAEALLDVGILLPLLRFRLPGGRERVLRVTMRRPCLGGQMRIVRHYLKLGITAREWDAFSEDEERAFFDRHAKRLSLILALTICRGYLSGLLLAPVVAWLIRWRVPDRSPALVPQNAGHAGFYEYYRIGREYQSLPVRSEPPQKSRKGELRTVYESSHSPFGIVWQIASATGWSVHYILWKVNFQTLAMMLADAPHYRSVPAECTEAGSATGKTDTAQLFQSKLNLQ